MSPQVVRGYAAIRRRWTSGDTVQLSLPMDVQRLSAHPNVLQAQGKIAVRRGPLIYAFEQADNAVPLRDVVLPAGAAFQTRLDPALAGGVVKLTTEGFVHDSRQLGRTPLPARPRIRLEARAADRRALRDLGQPRRRRDDRLDRFPLGLAPGKARTGMPRALAGAAHRATCAWSEPAASGAALRRG